MRIRWREFELPSRVEADKESLSGEYGRFVVEPFERGFGNTIGNGLRRVLLSSIEGTAVTAVRIAGAQHEFDSLEGIYEDVTDIILNIKRLRFRYTGTDPFVCKISKSGKGVVTGADVECPAGAVVVNQDLHIATLTLERDLEIELDAKRGRGYVQADENRTEEQELGTIPVDSIYSPVHRVRYTIEATRVGKFTNYDRLVLEIWTDGTIAPALALTQAAKIYRKHLNPFVLMDATQEGAPVAGDPATSEYHHRNQRRGEVGKLLDTPLADLELSVRARNCLDGAELHTLRDLVSLTEAEIMNLKNLGKTSLTEIKNKLTELGLTLGMQGD
ncbi:MAG TPA: DNA-directed RNA polymerase subunit alpha [Planctomycetota bacterium]|nr:DNA-directed RNA polymerase subunit alpha [Planctomycetota bacterium]